MLLLSNRRLKDWLLRDLLLNDLESLEVHIATFRTIFSKIIEMKSLFGLVYGQNKVR